MYLNVLWREFFMKKEALEVLRNRRAIRAYKSEQVSEELLKTVLEAGIYAPTAANKQSPVVVAVQNKEDRDTIARLNAAVVGRDHDTYYGAPTIIVVLGVLFLLAYIFSPRYGLLRRNRK